MASMSPPSPTPVPNESITTTHGSGQADACRQRGNEFFSKKDYQSALKFYDTANNLSRLFGEPKKMFFDQKVKCYENICLCRLELQQFAEAEAAANQLINYDPMFINGYRHRGVARYHLGDDYFGAVMDLTRVHSVGLLLAQDVLLLANAKEMSVLVNFESQRRLETKTPVPIEPDENCVKGSPVFSGENKLGEPDEPFPTPAHGSDEEWTLLKDWAAQGKSWAFCNMAFRIKAGYFKHASFYSQSLIKDNYEKAALLGNANGMMNLGTLYGNGRHGVERCNVKALEWWTKAAALGDLTARECLKIFDCSKKLCVACREGDFNTVKTLLASGNVNANFQSENGQTPLWIACAHGYENIVKLLLARKL